ncbi:MAG: radical SAM protein, partial [Thaumarchaeota archaeon]|nr:radical SAM protein [Nitrososphaerota archaeon]
VVEKPLAILTNSSLIFMDDVRSDLMIFDLVSLKIDAASKDVWRRINRPHPSLSLDEILRGARRFAREFSGELITETMLIENVNDDPAEIEAVADLVAELEPRKAYLAIPTRPPAESWAKPASEEAIVKAYEIFKERLGSGRVELLIGYEGSGFDLGENPVENILAIASVHPIMIDYAYQALSRLSEDPEKIISELVQSGLLKLVKYRGMSFLVRSWRG